MGFRAVLTMFKKKTNIVEVLELYLLIGKFAGFTTYTVKGSKISDLRLEFTFDDFLIYVLSVSFQVSILYFGRLEPKDLSSLILTFGTELILTLSLVTGIISATLMVLLRGKLLQILKLINHFDNQITLLGGKINYQLQYIVFGAMVAFSSLMIFVFFLFAYFYESNFGPIGILNFILSNVNFTVLMGFFFACLLGMRYRFSVYNECFEKHFEENFQPKIMVQPAKVTETYRMVRATTVNRLGSLHNNLCDIVELLNVCFGFQAMLFTGMCFTYSIFSIFASFRTWYNYSENMYYELLKYLLWFVYYYMFVLAIISVASSVTRMGKITAVSAHKAINMLQDPFTVEKLRLYAQQVTNRPPVVSCGLFTFDWTLFYSMCGASTTYLVILIQFDTSMVNSAVLRATNGSQIIM